MTAPAQSLEALLRGPTVNDHEEVLRLCNAAIKSSKEDVQLQTIKFVALVKLDRYDDALRVLEEHGDKLRHNVHVGKAYALYKSGRFTEAKAIAGDIKHDRGAIHVEAQASYRSEDFASAARSYKTLVDTQGPSTYEENDLRINSSATDAQLLWAGQGHLVLKKKPVREDLEALETAYNAACSALARNQVDQAEVLLKRATDLCNALDEMTEAEKRAEKNPIIVQQLYAYEKLGKLEEAEKIASDIIIDDIPDLSTRRIAQNNRLAATLKSPNPYIDHRVFHDADDIPLTDRLFRFQAEQMRQNKLTLDLLTLKYNGVIKKTKLLPNSQPTTSAHVNKLSVLSAAAHAQNELAKLGLRKILPLVDRHPKDIGLVMTIIQLYVLTKNYGSASTILESLLRHLSESKVPADQDVLHAPGLVALQVTMYSAQARRAKVKAVLAKAASYWRHKSKLLTPLFEAAGLALLESPDQEHQDLVRNIFSSLHESDPGSKFATAGYVAAYAFTAPDTIPAETNNLTPVARLIAGVDIDTLESAGVPAFPTANASVKARKRPLEEKPKPAKKRIQKSRMPKDYDSNKIVDPERWLPLRDRSSYRPRGKRGRQKAAEKTQGGVSERATEKSGGGEGVIKAVEKPNGGQVKGKKKKGKK